MSMYDSVYFTCPSCGEQMEAQSKGGPCALGAYPSDEVPVDVADGLRLFTACRCGKRYRVKPITMPKVKVEIEEV